MFKHALAPAVGKVLFCSGLASLFALSLPARSQSTAGAPKVLVIVREYTKPGREGTPHETTEAAYANTLKAAKGAVPHYTALTSVTGDYRALFMSGYPSIAAYDAERNAMSPALNAAIDKVNLADGEMLSKSGTSMWMRRDDLSSNIDSPGKGFRFLEVTQFVVKPGRTHEFEEIAKLYVDKIKGLPEVHWTTYELAYGTVDGPAYLVMTASRSAADLDAGFAANPKVDAMFGEENLKKIADLSNASIATEMTNLFVVNPKMSVPTDEMIAAEPDFWKPKAAAKTVSATARKPVAASTSASNQ